MPRRVFITAAEISGDQHAAGLVASLRQLDPQLLIEGHGGPAMRQAGAAIHHETTARAAMGYHAITRTAEVWSLLGRTRRHFRENRPDLLICVDSPAMNFHFARLAKRFGVPVLYYIAPQLWAWREGRMKKLRRWVDHLACILPFEEAYFRRHGVAATFVGHPLFDELDGGQSVVRGSPRRPGASPDPAAGQSGPAASGPRLTIGLLPGSRRAEATANFPAMLDAARQIRRQFPHARFLVPTTPATDPVVRQALAPGQLEITVRQDAFDPLVGQCDLCLVVSGTATLHVALHGVPMLVVYRASRLLWHLVGRWLIRTRTFALVNLLNDGCWHIVPEYIPWFGSAAPVAEHAIDLLRHPEKMEAQRRDLNRLVQSLARPGAAANTAQIALRLMKLAQPPAAE